VRCGRTGVEKRIQLKELVRRWSDRRGIVTVTDLHIRKSGVLRYMNCRILSDFNLLPRASKSVAAEEMLTVVMSSANTFTDSHTDDPDGSNHCFGGRKLRLVWDTFAGIKQGLEDFSRCDVKGSAATFRLDTFLSIPRSRWFVVEPGQTLFLPGHMAHKVITLEQYLGVGSFFVMLPSYLRALERWSVHTALWALELSEGHRMDLVNQMTRRVLHKVNMLVRSGHEESSRWGLDHLVQSARMWDADASPRAKRVLLAQAPSRDLIQTLLDFADVSSMTSLRKSVSTGRVHRKTP
jgi:hypothetical protein